MNAWWHNMCCKEQIRGRKQRRLDSLTLRETGEVYRDHIPTNVSVRWKTHVHTIMPQTQSVRPVGVVYNYSKGYIWGIQRLSIRIPGSVLENNRIRFPVGLRVVSVPHSLQTGLVFIQHIYQVPGYFHVVEGTRSCPIISVYSEWLGFLDFVHRLVF
jgi:hypothetical protein